MNIDKVLFKIEEQLDVYETTVEPETKMELKQTIQSEIKKVREYIQDNPEEDEDGEVTSSLNELEEVLTY